MEHRIKVGILAAAGVAVMLSALLKRWDALMSVILLGAAIVVALSFAAMLKSLSDEGDFVDFETRKRIRRDAEAVEALENSLGVTKARRPEPRERARSAPSAFSRPWRHQ
jgi:hypothetical protein